MGIIFDQLRISDDGKTLYIDAHVSNDSTYNGVCIDSITIMDAEKVSETDPETPTEDYIYKKVVEGEERKISLALTATDFSKLYEEDPKAMVFKQADMSKTLFFVYIKYKVIAGGIIPYSPCGSDQATTLGVVFYEKVLHQKVMSFTKELTQNCCDIPVGFIDYILLWQAFKSSVETGHYLSAIKFFNMLFDNVGSTSITSTKGCSCHG